MQPAPGCVHPSLRPRQSVRDGWGGAVQPAPGCVYPSLRPRQSVRDGGIKRTVVKCTEEHKLELKPPPDDFYPYADYVRQFGDPAKFKKRGHVVRRVNGIRGVVVPGTDRAGPWKLQRGFNSAVTKEDEHDTGGAGDDEGDVAEDVIQDKFEELRARREAGHKAAAVGIMADMLAQCAREATDEDRKVPRNKKRPRKEPAEEAVEGDGERALPRGGGGWAGCCSDADSDPPPSGKAGGARQPAGRRASQPAKNRRC